MLKGIILHGGHGTRLRPLTYAGPKQLIPIANKPVSQYALEDLVAAGVKDIAIVLGETFPELVREHYGDGSKFGAHIAYIYQGRPLGIAHAIGLCRDFVGDDPFIVYLGDNMFQYGIKGYVEKFLAEAYDALILLKEVEDPTRFGVPQFDGHGRLVRLVEKPKVPPSNYAVVGVYFLTPAIFPAIEELQPSWRGEYEIVDAIQKLIGWGRRVGHAFVEGWWADTGKKDDIIALNATILDERARRTIDAEVVDSKVEGRVEAGEGSRIVRSVVRGPAIIGRGCLIENSYVGPHTSIGDDSQIIDSRVEHSVILEGVLVKGVEMLEDSLIGRRARIVSDGSNRRALRLHIGDYSEVTV